MAGNVIEKYFGANCFSCPGISAETLVYGASLHGVNVEDVIKDLNNLGKMISVCSTRERYVGVGRSRVSTLCLTNLLQPALPRVEGL